MPASLEEAADQLDGAEWDPVDKLGERRSHETESQARVQSDAILDWTRTQRITRALLSPKWKWRTLSAATKHGGRTA